MGQQIDSTRLLAIEVLSRMGQLRRPLDHWLEWADQQLQSPRDRAFLRSLVYGSLRWQQRLDWIITQFATRSIKVIDPQVLVILRMGVLQLTCLDRVPDSAAVHTSVDLARHFRRSWAAGFINKVLRRVAAEAGRLLPPDRQNDPVEALAVQHSFPQWLINRWLQRWGIAQTEALCQALNTVPGMTLRTNTLHTTRAELLAGLQTEWPSSSATRHSPEGIVIPEPAGNLTVRPEFQRGHFQIQDEAAQLVGHLLSLQPGMTVWDACAGLGTKTGHIAQLMGNRGRIVATDSHDGRLARLALEMRRLGVAIAHQRLLDLSSAHPLPQLPDFDRILLDAPCSGLGVLRKNPDGKWSTLPADLLRHGHRQSKFMETVAAKLKPGGILVYSVCSLEPEETSAVIEDFLRRHPEFVIDRRSVAHFPNAEALMTPRFELCTLPHMHEMDGFFAVALIKHLNGK